MNSRETVSMQTGTYEIHLKKMSEKATDMPLTLQLFFPICRNNGTNLSKHFILYWRTYDQSPDRSPYLNGEGFESKITPVSTADTSQLLSQNSSQVSPIYNLKQSTMLTSQGSHIPN